MPSKAPLNIDEEIAKSRRMPFSEPSSEPGRKNELDGDEKGSVFQPLKYATNYVSVVAAPVARYQKLKIKAENEHWLKKYYMSKRLISHATLRQGSVTSASDTSVSHSDRSASRTLLDKFLNDTNELPDPFDLRLPPYSMGDDISEEEKERRAIIESVATSSYFNHYEKLCTVDLKNKNLLKRHTLWMPTMKPKFKKAVTNAKDPSEPLLDNKICPLFTEGTNYIPKEYDTYGGCAMITSVFSEYKLPAFSYHCAVEVNDQVYIIGGLVACYRYDEEAPELQDFVVDGVENLPPPLLPKIINNPSMINNARLYVMSITSSHVMRPEISGSVPPPLLCMRGSKLTERHIFFYGGFEIKTECTCDDQGIYHLKKRAFLNNTGYILDTMTYKFSKVELMAQPYKFVSFPTISARFGHMQMSIPSNHFSCNHGSNQKAAEFQDSTYLDGPSSGGSTAWNSSTVSLCSSSRNCNASHGSGVYTILIFGGYRQTGDDNYEAMNDLWKIEIPVVVRGKRGYCKFGDAAIATIIPRTNGSDPWPSCRAFFGYSIVDAALLGKSAAPDGLLARLAENFSIESAAASEKQKTMPIFPNIPHTRKETPYSRQHTASKETKPEPSTPMRRRVGSPLQSSYVSVQGKRQISDNGVVVIHGGSDKTTVHGDMWWFDLESETWSAITTYGKDEVEGLVPIEVRLVGQSMVSVGHISVSLGGFTQEEVDILFLNKEAKDSTEVNRKIGTDILNIFDLRTQCLQGHNVTMEGKGAKRHPVLAEDSTDVLNTVTSFGCQVLHTNGTIALVGGLITLRSRIEDCYLRGTVLECVLPSVSLAS